MSDERPWTERLIQQRWSLLLVAVVVSALTGGLWLFASINDQKPVYQVIASGQVYQSGASTWRLVSLRSADRLPSGARPVSGAVWVMAEVRAELADFPADGYCAWQLRAGDYVFESVDGYKPSNPETTTSCARGRSGLIGAAFEVPKKLVSSVDGVVLGLPSATHLLLSGRVE